MAECDAASSMEVPRSIEGVVLSPIRSENKPRRKRKKKKKKKKRPSTDPISSDDESLDFGLPILYESNTANSFNPKRNASSSESHISTPQEVLRRRLIEKDGYEAAQIEQAMEEMWDRGMPFDEYESVICYLQSGYTPTLCEAATASTTSTSALSISMTTEEEVDLASQSQNESLSLEESVEKDEGIAAIVASNGDIPTVIEENDREREEDHEEEAKDQQHEANEEEYIEEPTRPTMATKLDTVASFENLTDAIFALTQWVKKAASDEEVEIFCRAETTSALPTVIQRGVSSEIDDATRFETTVHPALVLLLMAVMSRCGIVDLKAKFRGELEEKIEQMLKQARKVSLLASDEYSENMIGDRVSRFIVSRLAIAMDEMHKHEKMQSEFSTTLYEADMMMALMLSLCDDLEAQASHAFNTVQSSMRAAFCDNSEVAISGGSVHTSPLVSTNSFEIQDISLHIVDEDTKKRFEQEKTRLEVLKSQVREEGERSETVQHLRESLFSLKTKRKGYQEKIAELRAALEELESQENDASAQIESLSSQLVREEQKEAADTKQLNEDIAQTKEAVRYGNLVCGLGGMMKSYGKSIEKATAFKTGREIQSHDLDESSSDNDAFAVERTAEETILHAMENYLSKVQKYFSKEAHCFTQLNQRLAAKTAEVEALESELAQYNSVKGLFATSVIPTQIKQAIERTDRLIQVYKQKLETHTDHGRDMYEKLLLSLETYRTNMATKSKTEGETDLFPSNLLAGVPAAIRALTIVDQDCERLAYFVKESTKEESANDSAKRDPDLAASESESSPQSSSSPSNKTSVPSRSYMPPKLNWATPTAKKEQGESKEQKKSFLDIQKEELTRSRDNAQSKD